MKKIKFLGLLVLLLVILPAPKSFAQAKVITNYDVEVKVVSKDSLGNVIKEYLNVNDAIEKLVFSSNGNFLRTVSIKVDKSHPFLKYSMPFAIVGISLAADLDDNGTKETLLEDKRAVITNGGVIKLVYHINNGHIYEE